jgi:3-(3-hydroxy-phenyl)propionate hydroxylase
VIIGAGPVGVTAANLLGRYGVETLVLERERAIVDYPRAIGIDDESLRTFQSVGLADALLPSVIQNVPLRFFDAAGHCLADIHPGTRAYGWYRRNIFMQPAAEAVLRTGLTRFPQVRLVLGTEVHELKQDPDGVTVLVAGPDGEHREIRADHVVAADGGRSLVRGLLGIPFDGTTHPRKWVVIDCAHDPLDAPYTALHGDPRRPYVSARMPDDHRRWEFMLYPGEDADEMLAPERVRDLLRPHVPDPEAVRLIRARVYTHHSRIARRFVDGRVALAGDAAHLMPPWAGQGLNTGIRDVANLCWKLAAITRGQAGLSFLDSYDTERRAHVSAMIDLSTTLGRVMTLRHRAAAEVRDRLLRAASTVPSVKRWIWEMRFKPMPSYAHGFAVADGDSERGRPVVGRMLPQPMAETGDGVSARLDDILGPWFAVIGFERDPLGELTEAQLAAVRRFEPRVVKVVASRAGDRHRKTPLTDPATLVVEDVEGQLRTWFRAAGRDTALVRPDRFVAAMTTAETFGSALTRLADRYGTGDPA